VPIALGRTVLSPPNRMRGYLSLYLSVPAICVRYMSHLVHRKRKCLTVSLAWPQAHWPDSALPIWCRYRLSRAIPVRKFANTFASRPLRLSYRLRVCLPGNAMSISLEYLRIPCGSVFFSFCAALATCIVVDFIWENCSCGSWPCSVAVGQLPSPPCSVRNPRLTESIRHERGYLLSLKPGSHHRSA